MMYDVDCGCENSNSPKEKVIGEPLSWRGGWVFDCHSCNKPQYCSGVLWGGSDIHWCANCYDARYGVKHQFCEL